MRETKLCNTILKAKAEGGWGPVNWDERDGRRGQGEEKKGKNCDYIFTNHPG